MSYALTEIRNFCSQLEEKLKPQVPNRRDFRLVETWNTILGNGLMDYLNRYADQFNNPRPTSPQDFQAYANLVFHAAGFLTNQSHSRVRDKLEELEGHVDFLIVIYNKNFSQFNLTAPQKQRGMSRGNPSLKEHDISAFNTPTPKTDSGTGPFINFRITKLQPLLYHRDFLKRQENKESDYSFFCFSPKKGEEHKTLTDLITKLTETQSFLQMKRVLDDFYLGKGIDNSRYEILNQGSCLFNSESLDKINVVYEEVNKKKDRQPVADTRRKDFFDSEVLDLLNTYRSQVLHNDSRDRTFKEDRKAAVVQALTQNLGTCENMASIRDYLRRFYAGKGQKGSDYEILNTGQNTTTRLFAPFGMKTTTIQLIDKLWDLAFSESYKDAAIGVEEERMDERLALLG